MKMNMNPPIGNTMSRKPEFDFWKAAEEAHERVKYWPDWKKDIRLTEYSTGLLKRNKKKKKKKKLNKEK
jgi:hypothetical protein